VKIIFSIKSLSDMAGGAERVFCTICTHLSGRGHDILIVTFDPPGKEAFYPMSNDIKWLQLGIGDPKKKSTIVEIIKRTNAVRRVLKSEKPDVVVGFMHSMFVPLSLASIGLKLPVIASEHITIEHYHARKFQLLLVTLVMPIINKMTVLSESIKQGYPKIIQNKMMPIVNPVETYTDSGVFSFREKRNTILNIGRLNYQKNQITLIKAFSMIADEHPNWNLRIVGEGSERGKLESVVKNLKLENRVFLPGKIKNIDCEYKKATLFVMSSHYEAFGLVTVEAMSHGMPVIGFSDCPGTNEIIIDNFNGLLIDPECDRIKALSTGISKLIESESLSRILAENAQNFVTKEFDVEHVIDCWEELLYSV